MDCRKESDMTKRLSFHLYIIKGFPGGSDGKACNAGDPGLISGSGRTLGEEDDYPLQYSCLENPMERGAVGYSPWGRKESDTT